MKKLTFIFVTLFMSFAHSQTIFKVNSDYNKMSLNECQANQNTVFKYHLEQMDSQIARLINGIQIETLNGKEEEILKLYRQYLLELLVERLSIEEMSKQLDRIHLKSVVEGNYTAKVPKMVFTTENLNLDLEKNIARLIEEILTENTFNFKKFFIDELKKDVLKDLRKALLKKVYNYVQHQFISGFITHAMMSPTSQMTLVSFGSHMLHGFAKGMLIKLITMPFRGYRLTAEDAWMDILRDYPEVILNPEWMIPAELQDEVWYSQCISFHRKTKYMETDVLKVSLHNLEMNFLGSIHYIDTYFESEEYAKEQNNQLIHYFPSDNTRAVIPKNQVEKPLPKWVKKNANSPQSLPAAYKDLKMPEYKMKASPVDNTSTAPKGVLFEDSFLSN